MSDQLRKRLQEAELQAELIFLDVKKHYQYFVGARNRIHGLIGDFLAATDVEKHLADANKLQSSCQSFDLKLWNKPFKSVDAFTNAILDSNLGFNFKKDAFGYQEHEGCSKESTDYLKKLASLMTIYRISLGITDVYQWLLQHNFIQFRQHKYRPETVEILIENYTTRLRDASMLQGIYEKVSAMQDDLSDLRVASQEQKKQFENDVLQAITVFTQAFQKAQNLLERGYNEFEDNSWLGDEWHCLLRAIASELFENHYSFKYKLMGALQIDDDFSNQLVTELDDCFNKARKHISGIKAAYLYLAEQELKTFKDAIQYAAQKSKIKLTIPDPNTTEPSSPFETFFFSKDKDLERRENGKESVYESKELKSQ